MSEFRVFAYDLNTNTKLTELPANGLTFDTRLNDSGSVSFTMSLQNPTVSALAAPVLAFNGAPFALYVDRDGVIVWGGLAWTSNYTRSTGELQISGKEFLSYFNQRVIAADYSSVSYPSGLDPAQLVFKAFTDAQNTALCGPGASIGLTILGGTSRIPHFVPGYPKSQHTTVSQVAADIASVSSPGVGTVDTTITCAWDVNGNPTRTLQIWSPRAGRSAASSGLIFDLSNVFDYTWPIDATKMGTTIIATGAGTGTATPTATVQSPYPVGGLGQAPRLDQVVSFTNVQSQAQVAAMAAGQVQLIGHPVATPTITVPAGGTQPLGTWMIGDDARLFTAGDERFPSGKDEYWRIVQYATTVPDEGVSEVVLTFNQPPSF